MTIRTLLLYLIGDREAILTIAADRRALWIGLLFVMSAAFAREYDGQDLLHEPWHLLIPLGASLVSSFVLFSVLYLKLIWSDPLRPRFFTAYRGFLTLFWMTAPLAWLYAIPYERFLSAPDALKANLATLGLVALWRVALMIRVAAVLMRYHPLSAVCLVMTFADSVALVALGLMPVQVIHTMSGAQIPITEMDRVALHVQSSLGCTGCGLLPFWLAGAIVTLVRSTPSWQMPSTTAFMDDSPTRSLWLLAISSVIVWVLVLPLTQPEQQLRFRAEDDLASGRIADALTLMSTHEPTDFPPHWRPPPRLVDLPDTPVLGHHIVQPGSPHILDVLSVMSEQPTAPWVREAYLTQLRFYFQGSGGIGYPLPDENQLPMLVTILLQLPEAGVLAEEFPSMIERALKAKDLTLKDQEKLEAILRQAGKTVPVQQPEMKP